MISSVWSNSHRPVLSVGFATTTDLSYFYLFYLDKCGLDGVFSQLTDLAFLLTSGLNINSNLRVIVKFLSQLSKCFPFPLQVGNYIWRVGDKEQAGFFGPTCFQNSYLHRKTGTALKTY